MTPFTPDADANALIAHLRDGVRAILGDEFVGMYLFGSIVLGAFNDGSDIDIAVVTAGVLPDALVAQLAAFHDATARLPSRYAEQIEASYIPRAAFRRYDHRDRHHPHLDRGEGERLVARRQHDEDWIVQRYVLYQHGIAVAGPDVRTLLDPVSAEALREAVVAILRAWWQPMIDDPTRLLHTGYQAYAVLSMCRMSYTLAEGGVLSKPAAAAWMSARQPRWSDAVRRALAWQMTVEDVPQTQTLIASVCGQAGLRA
jgi:hypothetical protein